MMETTGHRSYPGMNAPLASPLRYTHDAKITRASDIPFSGALQNEAVSDKLSAFYPSDRDSALCVASILAGRFPDSTTSSYLRVTSILSTTPSMSDWYDESPRPEIVSISDDKASIKSYDASNQQWFDETDNEEEEEPVEMTNRFSMLTMLTFGLQSSSSSASPSSDSQDSDTMVGSCEDSDKFSVSSSKTQIILDEELLHSPIDSFAALCWDSAVSDQSLELQQPSEQITQEERMARLRLSTLYNDDAHDYEEEQSIQSTDLDALVLPPMEFVPKAKTASSEVAPWLHIPRKAASILDLPQDLFSSTPFEVARRSRLRKHHRGRSLAISHETVLAKC